MAPRYLPLALTWSPTPRIEHFALLNGLEAAVRGVLISAMPIAVYSAMGDAQRMSAVYFAVGVISLLWGLLVPSLARLIARRWAYTTGCGLYLCGMAAAVTGTPLGLSVGLGLNAMATVTCFVCLNAYVLDYVDRPNLGRSQSTQMAYAATAWTIGPVAGVWMYQTWPPLPFLVAAGFALALLTAFWVLRLGNGKQITRARRPAVNPLAYLGRFFAQRRLIVGWSFAVIRSCGWWVYVVYLPVFCIQSGLGEELGGTLLSVSNAGLFAAPAINRVARRAGVPRSVRLAFWTCGALFLAGAALAFLPVVAVALIVSAAIFLVVLDVVGGLPFLMSVKPSERTEMAAVYSSFRDVSGILTPGVAWLVLVVAPLPGVFAAVGAALVGAGFTALSLHPRLGVARPSTGGVSAGSRT